MFLNEEFLKLWEELSELNEAKADTEKLITFAGEELANRFLAIKHRLKAPENDLYYWIKNKTPAELEQFVSNLESTKSKTKSTKDIAEGATLIGENDYWKVYHITTFEAARKYGRDSKWCITGVPQTEEDEEGTSQWWDEYKEDGCEFYFYITKGKYNPRGRISKFALAVYPSGRYHIFDQQDIEVPGIVNAPDIPGLPNVNLIRSAYYLYDGTPVPKELDTRKVKILEIAPTVTKIPKSALVGFTGITSLEIPESVTEIELCGCSIETKLTDLSLPSSLRIIGQQAFSSCKSLTSVVIPEGVISIGQSAFDYCNKLVDITLPKSVTSIGFGAFGIAYNNRQFKNIVITCPKDSYAEKWAKEEGFKVNVI